jgi:hypothetical protein
VVKYQRRPYDEHAPDGRGKGPERRAIVWSAPRADSSAAVHESTDGALTVT